MKIERFRAITSRGWFMVSMHTTRSAVARSIALVRPAAVLLCATTQTGLAAAPPRILQVSSPGGSPAAGVIREPTATPDLSTAEPPVRTSRRSEFVPIAVPEAAAPPLTPAPELPSQPSFPAEPLPAAPPDATSKTWQTGPQLAPPTAQPAPPPAALPQSPSLAPPPNPEPAAADQPPAAPDQPRSSTFESPALPRAPSAAMQAVAERALEQAEHASTMAQRGMLYSARTELIEALAHIAQSLDVENSTSSHAQSLTAGLTALEEAKDFARTSNQSAAAADVATIAAGHRTALFHNNPAAPPSPVIAQQQYFAYAQEQIAHAAGQIPAASQILYRLGRLQTALAAHDAAPGALHAPQAIVFHQAALATHRGNWLAANELGVLYARYGQLAAAKEMLLASVTQHPHVAGWQNLAAVHRRLGEADLAARADYERQMLAKSTSTSGASQLVRWVDSKTFAATATSDVRWPAEVAAKPAPGATTKK